MNILELANKVQKKFVSRKNGVGSKIEYYSFDENYTFTTTSVVTYTDFSQLSESDAIMSDNAIFYCVELPIQPKKRDLITIDECDWFVSDFVPNGEDLYDIKCTKNKRHTARSKGR